MEHVITISPHGTVKALYNEKFRLDMLGMQHIVRASEIKFNETTQQWDIWFRVDESELEPFRPYQGFMSYDEGRDFEVKVMNECFKRQMLPSDHDILNWARWQRMKRTDIATSDSIETAA